MPKNFDTEFWQDYIPKPICEQYPEYESFYMKAWELAHDHIKHVDGMPQDPYMDEAFCDTQIWIWDTCFMSLFCKFAREVFPGVESFGNFYEVLFNEKTLPAVTPGENEPVWTGAKAGIPFNIRVHIADNPPLFAWAEYENALFDGDEGYLRDLLYKKKDLQRHYEMLETLKTRKKLPNVSCDTCWISEDIGYRWEGGRSGMDNTPRGRQGDRATTERPAGRDMLWIDAICQQALAAKKISELFAIVGDSEQEHLWNDRYLQKKNTVNSLYWDDEDEFYYDIDQRDRRFYKVRTMASYWALTAQIASPERAEKMISYLFDSEDFGGIVPFTSLSRKDADFSEKGCYWRGSVWLPTAYAALKGVSEYGYFEEAHKLAQNLLDHMFKTYDLYEPNTIWECYSPTSCAPAMQVDDKTTVRPDSCGWSALGPISIYLEYVLGFHTVNAFKKIVEWEKPMDISGKIGVENLRFGNIITDIVADEEYCTVISNAEYTLKINGTPYAIANGTTKIKF